MSAPIQSANNRLQGIGMSMRDVNPSPSIADDSRVGSNQVCNGTIIQLSDNAGQVPAANNVFYPDDKINQIILNE